MPSTTTQSSQLVQEVIALGPQPLLKALGFRKSGRHFFSTETDATCHINFQSSQWNAPDRSIFTVNVWTYLPAIALAHGDILIEEPAKQRFGHCGIRLGFLLTECCDRWWEISSSADVPPTADEVRLAIEEFAIPYLRRASTLQGVAELNGHLPGHRDLPAPYKVTALRLLGREQEAADAERALIKR